MCKCYFHLIVLLSFVCVTLARKKRDPPPPPLECYKCNSDDLHACATSPITDLPSANCSHFRDQCVTTIIDGVIFRGCTGEIVIPIDIELFTYCNSSLCNNEIYPPGRRKCYQCEGSNCLTNFTDTLKPCVNYEEDDYCVSDVIDESDMIRGCLSDPNYNPGPFAQMCTINSCNDHPAVTQLECITCSSKDQRNCATSLAGGGKSCSIPIKTTCNVDTLLGRPNDTCFVYHKYDKVIRGCTRYGGKLQLDEKFFNTCEGRKCNNQCISDRMCLACDSSKDPKCATDPGELTLQNCPRQSYCHSCEKSNGIITRGCGEPDSVSGCYKCQDSDGCNKKNFLKCYNCSSEDDPNCAQWTNSNKINMEICSNPDDSCLVAIRSDGHTIRGCSSAKRPCAQNTKCTHCSGPLCNAGVFPADRQLCYHCEDDTKCRENLGDIKAIPCRKYTRSGGCFQYVNKNHEMVRGCRSDKEFASCTVEGDKCLICSESGCNNRLAARVAEISCISCNEKNKSCPWSQKSKAAIKCTQQVPYYLNETCFIRADKNGTVTRGCSVEKEACTEEYPTCITCQFDGCNTPKILTESCIQCQSDAVNQTTCASLSEGIAPKLCNADVQYYEDRGCYVKRENDVVKRGCVVDLTDDDRQKCKNNDRFCHYCDGRNCNKNLSPPANHAQYLGASSELFGAALLLTVRWFYSTLDNYLT